MTVEMLILIARALYGGSGVKRSSHGLGTLQGQTSLTGGSLFRGEERLRQLSVRPVQNYFSSENRRTQDVIGSLGGSPMQSPILKPSSSVKASYQTGPVTSYKKTHW